MKMKTTTTPPTLIVSISDCTLFSSRTEGMGRLITSMGTSYTSDIPAECTVVSVLAIFGVQVQLAGKISNRNCNRGNSNRPVNGSQCWETPFGTIIITTITTVIDKPMLGNSLEHENNNNNNYNVADGVATLSAYRTVVR